MLRCSRDEKETAELRSKRWRPNDSNLEFTVISRVLISSKFLATIRLLERISSQVIISRSFGPLAAPLPRPAWSPRRAGRVLPELVFISLVVLPGRVIFYRTAWPARLRSSYPAAGRGRAPNQGATMARPTEEQIRQRAQEIWEENHRPVGRDDEFWHQAEQELRNADKSSPLRTPNTL
jgi:hypothetical protein